MKGVFPYAVLSFVLNIPAALVILLLTMKFSTNSAILGFLFDFFFIVQGFLFLQMLVGIAFGVTGDTEKSRNVGRGIALNAGILLFIGGLFLGFPCL